MTADQDDPLAGVKVPKNEAAASRAYRAFARATQMRPGLEQFMRAMADNKQLNLHMGGYGASFTDGQDVWITPPMELGDEHQHQRNLCNRFDETGLPLCEACQVMEELQRIAVHEIAHIVKGSFRPASAGDIKGVINLAAEKLHQAHSADPEDKYFDKPQAWWAKKITNAVNKARTEALNGKSGSPNIRDNKQASPYDPMGSYIALARFISPWLPAILNSFEDARVNAAIHRTRPGTRRYFRSAAIRLIEQGILTEEGTMEQYRDRPPNVQIPIAALLVASGYDDHLDLAEYFDAGVAQLMQDKDVRSILQEVGDAPSSKETFNLGQKFLRAVQAEGYMPEPEPEKVQKCGQPQPGALALELDDDDEQNQDHESEDDGHDANDGRQSGSSAKNRGGDNRNNHGAAGAQDEADEGDSAVGDDDPGPGTPGENQDGDGDGADADSDESGQGQQSDGNPSSGASGQPEESSADGEAQAGSQDGDSAEPNLAQGQRTQRGGSSGQDSSAPAGGEVEGDEGEDPQAGESGQPATDRGAGLTNEEIARQARMAHADLKVASGHADELDEVDKELEEDSEQAPRDPKMPAKTQPNRTSEKYGEQPDWSRSSNDMAQAKSQFEFFRTPSQRVGQVNIMRPDTPAPEWNRNYLSHMVKFYKYLTEGPDSAHGLASWDLQDCLVYADYHPEEIESVARSCVASARLAFTENRAAKRTRNQKQGKLYTPTAGRKLKTGDPKVFGEKSVPNKRDYAVLFGGDVSASTAGQTALLIKQMAYGCAEMMAPLGVKFAMYFHTSIQGMTQHGADVDLIEVKNFDEPWNSRAKLRLQTVTSVANNLDGHTMEVYRKLLMRQKVTDRVLVYITDGAMPAANYQEEREILVRELATIRKDPSFHVKGVGVGTDSPKEYGLDTVIVEGPDDLPKVVRALQELLQ